LGNFLLLFISISLAIAGQLLMKQGMMIFGKFPVTQLLVKLIPMVFQPYVFIGILCFAVSSVFWLVVLSRIDLSLAYPLVSIAYIVTAIFSYYVFKENVSFIRWIGIITICLGVFLVSRS
jgi:multidrug transporter EmrE-like cation transporter